MMGLWQLAKRAVAFYWRTSLALACCVCIGSAVLVGALTVGSSVRGTLKHRIKERLGQIVTAVPPSERFFSSDLADRLSLQLGTNVASVLMLPGHICLPDQTRRVNRINLIGIDHRFLRLCNGTGPGMGPGLVWLNKALADRLGVETGQELLIQFATPSQIPSEGPYLSKSRRMTSIRANFAGIMDKQSLGEFSLINTTSIQNAFVYLPWLQDQIDRPGKANCLLMAKDVNQERFSEAIKRILDPADVGLRFGLLQGSGQIELTSQRVFLADPLADLALRTGTGPSGVLTYLVNTISNGSRTCPYSFVCAIGQTWPYQELVPSRPDEIVINQFLAQDIKAEIGDRIELEYYTLDQSGQLVQGSRSFIVSRIVPMDGPAIDPNLMPQIPGLSDSNSCSQWDPGLPIDLSRIRPIDEQYWAQYRGTPKAFISLVQGTKMWANRYGRLTAIRWPLAQNDLNELRARILADLDPAVFGLVATPVLAQMEIAARQATDLGLLLVGMNTFLIAAGLILVGLVFRLHIESRAPQIGLLLAIGWDYRRIHRLFLIEGILIVGIGSCAAGPVGIGLAWALLSGFEPVWNVLSGRMGIRLHTSACQILAGIVFSLMITGLVIFTAGKAISRKNIAELMSGLRQVIRPGSRYKLRISHLAVGLGAITAAAVLAFLSLHIEPSYQALGFFVSGALMLFGLLVITRLGIINITGLSRFVPISRMWLVIKGIGTRPGRAVAVLAMLACGVFMVISVGANRPAHIQNPTDRRCGTGGFAVYAHSTIPILADLNSHKTRRELGLESLPDDVQFVQARIVQGDQADCLNLARAQRPVLLAVDPQRLSGRFSFRLPPGHLDWDILNQSISDDVVPAVGDYATVVWSLKKGIGQRIEYKDQFGRPFWVQIIGILEDSIWQGGLLISQDAFLRRFPATIGYEVLLVDSGRMDIQKLMRTLASRLADYGLELQTTQDRLAMFQQVEAMYLSVFTVLGGMGLVFGTVGLAVVVLRNLMERRAELAIMLAVGFDRVTLVRLTTLEHLGLLLAGIIIGTIASILAIAGVLRVSAQLPVLTLSVTILAIFACGYVCIRLATRVATAGIIWDALRNE